MAKLESFIPGMIIRGRIGDTVFKYRNGKQFIARRPRKKSGPVNESLITNRKIFSDTAKISRAIADTNNSDKVWLVPGSRHKTVYNTVFSNIYGKILMKNLQDTFYIYPEFGVFSTDLFSAKITEKKVTAQISFKDLNERITEYGKYVQMAVIIVNRYPLDKMFNDASIISWSSKLIDAEKQGGAKFSLNIMGSDKNSETLNLYQLQTLNNYIEHHVFAAFLLLDKDMKPAGYSTTARFYFET